MKERRSQLASEHLELSVNHGADRVPTRAVASAAAAVNGLATLDELRSLRSLRR